MPDSPSRALAEFASSLKFEQIPQDVIIRAQWLFFDWYGSAIAGSNSHSAKVFRDLAAQMGPQSGPCQVFGSKLTTSPLFAAMINGAASHVVEQDDLHNSSILHPATVVFPPIFAVAQAHPEVSGKDFLTAAVVGYECGIRVGEFLGPSHYKVFHMTGTAGTVAAAMAVGKLLNLDVEKTLHALGSAGTQASGLWEFLRDAADSKQLHTASASANGIISAFTAQSGLTAASQILEGEQGMAAGMLGQGDTTKLVDRLGSRWGLMETSFKFHASCRHTHPAADALLEIRNQHNLDCDEIDSINAYVYQTAKDVLGAVDVPTSIHQSKFSMGFVLALIARYGVAGVNDFSEAALQNPVNAELRSKVKMIVDDDIDQQYPNNWCARVEVKMTSGEIFSAYVDTPKGDPGNMLGEEELIAKVEYLAEYSGVVEKSEIQNIKQQIWTLTDVRSFAHEFN